MLSEGRRLYFVYSASSPFGQFTEGLTEEKPGELVFIALGDEATASNKRLLLRDHERFAGTPLSRRSIC